MGSGHYSRIFNQYPDTTPSTARRWKVGATIQLWTLASKAWESLSSTKRSSNAHIAQQSDLDAVVRTKMYAQQHVICISDSHLFQHPLPDLLRASLGVKRRFLEKAEFLLKEAVHQTSAEQSDLSAKILFQYS